MDAAKNRDVQLPVCALDKLLVMARSLDQTEAPLEQRLHIFDDDGSDQPDECEPLLNAAAQSEAGDDSPVYISRQ